MLLAKIDLPGTYSPFLKHPVWTEVLEWVRRMPQHQPHGIYEIRGQDIYANVHGYATLPRQQCRYESHRRYVDLQYCIEGGESIEWHPAADLKQRGDYDPKKDVMHYDPPDPSGTILKMSPGTFAIFFPEDGHMPKLSNSANSVMEKVVVKINVALLRSNGS